MKITQLERAVMNVTGASFIGLDTLTEVKLSGGRGNPMQGRITKRMVGASVMVFTNTKTNGYDAMIKRRLEAEGKDPANFQVGPRTWGVRIPDMPIVVHEKDGNTKYYLEVIFLKPGKVEYQLDGSPIAPSEIQGLTEAKEGDQGGLDNKVYIRAYAADSITAIRIDGKEFK